MRTFLYIVCSIIFFSCANTAETVTDEILDGNYRILEIRGDKSLPENIILSFNPVGNRVSGNLGCNQFSALYQQQGNDLEFSTPMNTRKYCEGKMVVEKQILSSLEKASRLDHTEKLVVVYSKDNVALMTLTKIDRSE